MKERRFTCIVCPSGCDIVVRTDSDGSRTVEGNTCPRGEEYVLQEMDDPRRTIATSVMVKGGELPLASVRTDRTIPKGEIKTVMREISRLSVQAPVHAGTVLIRDVCGLGSDVIITKNVERRYQEKTDL